MQYTANFERATAVFDLLSRRRWCLSRGQKETIPLGAALGYELEIAYFLDCIAKGVRPTTVTMEDAASAVSWSKRGEGVATGKPVRMK